MSGSLPQVARMGYQPSLDGLRALSVIGVLLYHGGFSWMPGGFFGVEVFFVVSGFLITSLLLDERERHDRVDFRSFWLRRVRRLFPALYATLAAVAVWTALFGSDRQQSDLRRDLPWNALYAGNWGQILGNRPYFEGDSPPMLRHLWSLAVEEQWYLLWPLVFVGLVSVVPSLRRLGVIVLGAAVAVMAFTFWLHRGTPTLLGGPPGVFDGLDRTNFMYLSTFTRASGLLLGAGAAFVWRPWRWANAATAPVGRLLDPLGAGTVALLGCVFAVAHLEEGYVYQWLLPIVSVLSLVVVAIAVHPAANGFRAMTSNIALVEIGKRSYGLYLWSWPIFVAMEATTGSIGRFVAAMAVSAVVAEVSYRFLETPVREGVIGRWWKDRAPITYAPIAGGAVLVASLGLFFVNVEQFDQFEGGENATFDASAALQGESLPAVDATGSADAAPTDTSGATESTETTTDNDDTDALAAPTSSTTSTTSTTVPAATSARLAIVGDSQANALAINPPDGIGTVFPAIVNGSVDGCGVYDSGKVRSAVSFNNNFAICEGWQDEWADAAAEADVALVVIGAWDVFDLVDGDTTYVFQTAAADQKFAASLMSGIDAMLETGTNVGLLEVACMRPQDVRGAGVRALPERGDDARVAHLNTLLRYVSSQYGPEVSVIDGPDEWCEDEAIASDLGYRWDGVHVYKPGAKLIFETVAQDVLQLAAR